MTDRTPEQIRDEAARILDSEMFQGAVARVKQSAMDDLLRASGPDADLIRREKANLITAVDAVIRDLQAQMSAAKDALRPRGQVA